MNNYLISVVIPTKNRQKYCFAAIEQILAIKDKRIQICIQDNSDNKILEDKIFSLDNTDIVYHYHGGVLSFVDNFSEAISLAKGDYVCMIGDDDGILPNIINVAQYALSNEIDAIIPGFNSVYFWPSEKPILEGGEGGVLSLVTSKKIFIKANPHRALISLLKRGGLNYIDLDLPRVYHGLVKRTMFDQIIQKTGFLFGGLTPDIYMAGALSFVCKNTVRIHFPITCSGICPTSGSSDSATGRHTGELIDAPHFNGHDKYEWEEIIPYIYSVETIWAETLLKVLHNFKSVEYMQYFNIKALVDECYEKYPQFSERLQEFAFKNNIQLSRSIKKNFWFKLKYYSHKVINILKYGRTYNIKKYNVQDIEKAVILTTDILKL